MEISGQDIADVVLNQFEAFPAKGKPLNRGNGAREWVPLSGIVAHQHGNGKLVCIAAATGMKCLPQNKIARAQGAILHDWHAEILAIRSFNRFLLDECHSLASSKSCSSDFIKRRNPSERTESKFQPFALKDGITLYMYCSEAPCGDASMELTMAAQDDSTPWELPPVTDRLGLDVNPPIGPLSPLLTIEEPRLHGRGYFSALGVVRRKPARPDAPPTLSKSCSDKLALRQCTSILSSLTSLLISPSNVYISSLVVPESQFSASGLCRAFSADGRMKNMASMDWGNGYSFNPFDILTTRREFNGSRRQVLAAGERLVPSNISASWTPHQFETLIAGVLEGRRQGDPKGASRVCRRKMWELALQISTLADAPRVQKCLRVSRYADVKESDLFEERRGVKDSVLHRALVGWVKNEIDGDFTAEGAET